MKSSASIGGYAILCAESGRQREVSTRGRDTESQSMSQIEANCNSCGAPPGGLVCAHCGKVTSRLNSAADENHALDEYHKLLGQRKPEEQSEWLLTSGFLPDHSEVLIEAGIYCVPLLKNPALATAAAARLEAITLKLDLMPGADRQTRRAIADFQQKIKAQQSTEKTDTLLVAGCFLSILLAVGTLCWWLIFDAGWFVVMPLILIGTVSVIVWLLRR